jgi:aldehyde:ferredoxin oxidoreductase
MRQRLDGPTEGNTPDFKIQLKEWYEYRNYDIETGYPNKELLEQLEMSSFIRENESLGV